MCKHVAWRTRHVTVGRSSGNCPPIRVSSALVDVLNIPFTVYTHRSSKPLDFGSPSGDSSTVGWILTSCTRPASAFTAGSLSLVCVWPMLPMSLAAIRTSSGLTFLLPKACSDHAGAGALQAQHLCASSIVVT